jgi:aminopeptidase-like protein
MGGESDPQQLELAMLWLLSLCDGSRTLLDVAERAQIPFDGIERAADLLVRDALLAEVA